MPDQVLSLDSLLGVELSHYRIIQEIGSGGMGVIFRAHDEHLDREVAIKVLHPGTIIDEGARKHLHKEALALSKLNHANIATIHDFDTQRGIDFLVMEYIPGVTLNEKLAAGPLPEAEVLRLGMQLSDGLAAAHEHGVVHCDLKPGNLRLASDGRLKILDFGLAKLRRSLTESAPAETTLQTQAISGTFAYIAPEQLMGEELDARTDIHGAGLVLYEMATGQRAFAEVQSGQLIGAILRRSPAKPRTLNPKLSPELERIIGMCLEKDPQNRYQTAKELLLDLRRLSASNSVPAETAAKRRRPQWQLAAVGAVAVIGVSLAIPTGLNVGGWRDRLLGRAAPKEIRSLAVLPLMNMSGDPSDEYFADAMTEAITAELAQISGLKKVTSRTSAMLYKATRKPMPVIAKELQVDAVIEGSVQRAADKVRITVVLIDPARDRHLWAKSYERDMRNILALEREVARTIASEIQVTPTPQEQMRLASALSVDPQAFEESLRGRYFLRQWGKDDFMKSIEHFRRAIDIDPGYAPAYAGLADAYSQALLYGYFRPKDLILQAKENVKKAIQLDDSLADNHLALAKIRNFYDWDWDGAEREFKRALELNPNFVDAHIWYSEFLVSTGRFEEAIAVEKRAVQLDPLGYTTNLQLGWVLYNAQRYDESIAQLQKTIELNPKKMGTYMELGWNYAAKGQYHEAIANCEKALDLVPESTSALPLSSCGSLVFAKAGQRERVLSIIDRLKIMSERSYSDAYNIAILYAGLGDKDQAFKWFERAFQEKSGQITQLKAETLPDSMRSDPRFKDLLRRMNIPP